MPYDEKAKGMLEKVAKIRELGASRIERIENLEQAKKLWVKANDMLEKADVTGYLASIEELHKFMKASKLEDKDLRAELSDKSISPKGFAILEQIWGAASDYSMSAATLHESTKESGFVSAVSKMSAFFMDCKLKPNEPAEPDKDFQIDKSKILISIMQYIKNVADPDSKIGFSSTKALMTYKIAAILKLEKNNNVNVDSLEQVLSSKGENLSQYLSYKYAAREDGREHRYTATAENFKDLKDKYQGVRGDALKTEILSNFKDKLAEATDKASLDKIVKQLKSSDEYTILKTGQGRTTQLLGLKTSSVVAFEKMIKEVETDFKSRHTLPKSM
jgi:effector protein DrrA/SidM